MMRVAILLLLSVVGACRGGLDELPVSTSRIDALPSSWRPSSRLRESLDDSPWTATETARARRSALAGVEEMARYFREHPETIAELGVNAVECFLNATYAASDHPELDGRAREEASLRLRELVEPWLRDDGRVATADDFGDLVVWASYAHQLFGVAHPVTRKLVDSCNAALAQCESLTHALGVDWRSVLDRDPVPNEEAYELLLWVVTLTEARRLSDLRLPGEVC